MRYFSNRRDESCVNKTQELLLGNTLSTEAQEIVTNLLKKYEDATYEGYDGRHEFYRSTVSSMVNDTCFEDDELAEHMSREHPTLQQSFMRMALKFIKRMSLKRPDPRNEGSVKMAQTMMDSLNESENSCYLPYI